jgi:hypothetical protein
MEIIVRFCVPLGFGKPFQAWSSLDRTPEFVDGARDFEDHRSLRFDSQRLDLHESGLDALKLWGKALSLTAGVGIMHSWSWRSPRMVRNYVRTRQE